MSTAKCSTLLQAPHPPVVAHRGDNAADVLVQPLQAHRAGGQLCCAGGRVGALLAAWQAALGLQGRTGMGSDVCQKQVGTVLAAWQATLGCRWRQGGPGQAGQAA